ncbi:MAG: hypothetical protein PHC64_03065, partial [Candidatus Gastranaerophilales bacterium]|nr:hypothetical protein [Candidatus Gastranaerophilales bacterium]
MSIIKPIQLTSQYNPINKQPNFAQRQNFSGSLSKKGKQVLKAVEQEIDVTLNGKNFLNWPLKKIANFLGEHDGEIQTTLLNALFTGTLAYYVIAHNPLSNKSKEDKKYSALRQPVSALIAASGGLAMTLGINKYMDRIISEGHIEAVDGRLQPGKGYLTDQFKREYKSKTPQEQTAFLEGIY